MDQLKLIKIINDKCPSFFLESTFKLHPKSYNNFRATGSIMSQAINFRKNGSDEVSVVKWFRDFWFYMDIRFLEDTTFISVSIFQGEPASLEKNQLFRAEWDDYNNPDELHPQPHWHITSNQALEAVAKDYAEIASEDSFMSVLEEEKTKVADVSRLHFAMNGNWQNDDSHVHMIQDHEKIAKWLIGLLDHLKTQLTYISK